jgi:glucokinase
MSLTVGLDVGGTKVAAGVVDARGAIIEKLRRPTPAADPEQIARVIAAVVADLRSRHTVEAVGLGAAGFVSESRATVLFAPHLAWRDDPLKKRVEDLVGLPVVVDNDANASVWAEARFGAARGHQNVVLLAIGTGIGGGLMLGGQIYRGRWGMAGEPGHYRVVPDGRVCACGNRGCLEQYASGSALVAEARELARCAQGRGSRMLQLGGGRPEGIGGPQVTHAAREGDPDALRCFQIVGGWLGQAMADLAAILDPGCFVIGGGVSDAGDLLLTPARAAFDQALTGRGYRACADVRIAELGADAGLVGAADLARSPDQAHADQAGVDQAAPR